LAPEYGSSGRPISVLQLATALAFVALPATVLFPIIARPASTTPVQSSAAVQIAADNSARTQLQQVWITAKLNGQVRAKGQATVQEFQRLIKGQ